MNITWCVNMPFPAVRDRMGWPQGGSGWWMVELARRLSLDDGVRLTIVNCNPKYPKAETFSADGVTYSVLPAKPLELAGVRNARLLRRLAAAIEATEPDLVDIHGTEYCYGQVTRLLDVPTVVTLQGVMADIMPRYFADVGMGRVLWRQARCGTVLRHTAISVHGYLFGWLRCLQERKVFRANRHYVGRTDWDHGCQKRFRPDGTYHYCHRILRPAFAERQWRPDRLARHRILCVAAPEVYKGVHVLLEALPLVRQRFGDATLRLGGSFDTSGWGRYLQRRVRELHLESQVQFLGYLTPEKIAAEAEESSIFVAPSFMENECIALAEAMRVGMPCVASAAGGMTSTVANEHDGLHFPPGDWQRLAEQITKLFAAPKHAVELAAQARQTAIERHDPDLIARTTMANYQAVLAAGSAATAGA